MSFCACVRARNPRSPERGNEEIVTIITDSFFATEICSVGGDYISGRGSLISRARARRDID